MPKLTEIVLHLCLTFTLAVAVTVRAEEEQRPNLLFILADDVTYTMLGCYGGVDAKTPHIDRLASEGIRFTHAYAASAMCAPFRAELYTGLYPVRNGVAWNHSQARPGTKSVCHYLTDLGYRVGWAGKKHASPASSFPFVNVSDFPSGAGVRRFMARDKTQPFCLFLCSHNAHAAWTQGDSSQFDESKISLTPVLHDSPETREVMTRYLAEVTDLDREVGQILRLLDDTGQRDNTLVMFSSEQGWALGFAKWTNWDIGIHTGFVARWPGKIKPNRTSNMLIQMADVLPTFIEAAGGKVEADQLDGFSFYRHLLGQEQPSREYVYGLHNNVPEGRPYPIRSIRDKEYHYIWNLTPDASYHGKHAMIEDSRLIWWPALKRAEAEGDADAIALLEKCHHRPEEELYRVDQDPYEMNNLADDPELQQVKARLRTELKRWMAEQGDTGQAMDNEAALAANRGSRRAKKPLKKR